MASSLDSFSTRSDLKVDGKTYQIFRLSELKKKLKMTALPYTLRIFLENMLRNEDGRFVKADDIQALATRKPSDKSEREVYFMPARVLMQDFTGVPAIVDLAAMRDAVKRLGGDPKRINPLVPVDLVIDHSVQVERYGDAEAFSANAKIEFDRNIERYRFLKWGQQAFRDFTVVPPDTGIVHQVNLEYIARCVSTREQDGRLLAFPDTLVGTDSHTTMVNGLGVLGWGVGGIEAEAAMLGQPMSMLIPEVVGFKLTGALPAGATATDAVLTVTEILRRKGVVGKFVEFYGPGLASLSLADRATIANMCPEYGATVGYFPIDAQTIEYLKLTGRPAELLSLVEAYAKAQDLFYTDQAPEPEFSEKVELDLGSIKPCIAGPRRPQDRIELGSVKASWSKTLPEFLTKKDKKGRLPAPAGTKAPVSMDGKTFEIEHGSVVIAAITSCTNTSNPSVLLAAGLLAKKAVEKGLSSKPWVKTSLAPGSKVVMDYLKDAGVQSYLEQLGFYLVGFGCTTCIGNSGPLAEPISQAVSETNLVVGAVLSGNRNFEGRIHPLVKANYLASPPLVVAYALAGRVDLDLTTEPLGTGKDGKPVFLKDIWPTNEEVRDAVKRHVSRETFIKQYSNVYAGDERWKTLEAPTGDSFAWDSKSTYIKHPPYFEGLKKSGGEPAPLSDIHGARALAILGDSVTTDHISPAGSIATDSPAGKYLVDRGVEKLEFNSYGARRGNHELMVRGTFANIRLRNLMVDVEGGMAVHLPEKTLTTIFEASESYLKEKKPLVVIAGKEYGSGSSRDWAAKGPNLLGIKAAIAESYERIHRSNLVGMGILPLQFMPGESAASLGLTGRETFDFLGVRDLKPKKEITVVAKGEDGKTREFKAIARIDTPIEVEYYRYGGILTYVLCQLLSQREPVAA
ncbi:MAG: aconitate hydratase AcnA [Elusimicrobia bacterium]|nr:aconitate hydratase AcnA [Elusimicrobiota bacterium]